MTIAMQQQILKLLETVKKQNDSTIDLQERVASLEKQVKELRDAKKGLFGTTLGLGKANG